MHNPAVRKAAVRRASPSVPTREADNPQQREAQVQQALIELFPHLRSQAYNALREMFPTPRQS